MRKGGGGVGSERIKERNWAAGIRNSGMMAEGEPCRASCCGLTYSRTEVALVSQENST